MFQEALAVVGMSDGQYLDGRQSAGDQGVVWLTKIKEADLVGTEV